MIVIHVLPDIKLSLLHQAIDAANLKVIFEHGQGFTVEPRHADPMLHNLSDSELLKTADLFHNLPIVAELAKRLESARLEGEEEEEELAAYEKRVSELEDRETELEKLLAHWESKYYDAFEGE